jgi:hypothetical protein
MTRAQQAQAARADLVAARVAVERAERALARARAAQYSAEAWAALTAAGHTECDRPKCGDASHYAEA